MDINCTSTCRYQKDGKCRLTQVETQRKKIAAQNADCPYFSEPKNS